MFHRLRLVDHRLKRHFFFLISKSEVMTELEELALHSDDCQKPSPSAHDNLQTNTMKQSYRYNTSRSRPQVTPTANASEKPTI